MTATTNSSTESILHIETYQGREIKVVLAPRWTTQHSARAAAVQVFVEGHSYQGGRFPIETYVRQADGLGFEPVDTPEDKLVAKAIKKGRQWVDANIADDEIRPSLEQSIAYLPRSVKAEIVCTGSEPTDFEVGDLVWFFSRGNIRQGRVEKVGKTNVGVAYVTEVGGYITRKSLKPGQVGFAVEEVSV